MYGQGHSEEVVAEALRSLPKSARPHIFSKCGVVADPNSPEKPPQRIGAAASIRKELEQSLRRLRVEIIDLYQMHWPPRDGTPVEDYWLTLLDLKREGKVRAVGLSNHDIAALNRAEKLGHIDSLQPPFSAIRRESAGAEIPWCHAHETGVIIYSPMQSGLLTGKFNAERAAALPPSDWRSRNEEFNGEKLQRNLALADAMQPIAARRGVSVATLSVAWALACPGVTAAIVGARKPWQVTSLVEAATVELTREELTEIRSAIERSGAGAGPLIR
jgi:aryl-alcohol dehydrogenase-like predicted oxidoreductase